LSADYWWAILVLGAVVYATRVVGLVAIPSGTIPPWAERRLRLAPVAILTALVAPSLVTPSGVREPAVLIAAIIAAAAAALSRQPVIALIVGVIAVVALRAVM
jgi:branched-subunit amino acid transport protein